MALNKEIKDLAQTLTGINFTKSYKPEVIQGKQTVGYGDHTFNQIDPKYKVIIENSIGGPGGQGWRVNAWLQEGFEFDVTSNWGELISIPSLGGLKEGVQNAVNTGVKAVGGVFLKNMAMTRRKWDGSSPLRITLKLEFRAYDDAQSEVLNAVQALQAMVLPEEASSKFLEGKGVAGGIIPGFLVPPGPNEQFMNGSVARGKVQGNARSNQTLGGAGDLISIDLFGGGFYLDMVLIRSVKAIFDPKMTSRGPVSASVDVTIESYEVLTKQKLSESYRGEGYLGTSIKAKAESLIKGSLGGTYR